MRHVSVISGHPISTSFCRLTGYQRDPRDRGVTEYRSYPFKRMVLFKYDWFNPSRHGTRRHLNYSLVEVNQVEGLIGMNHSYSQCRHARYIMYHILH